MSVFKRGDSWYVRFTVDGKRVAKRIGPDYRMADAVQKRIEMQIAEAKASGLAWTGLAKINKAKQQKTFGELAEKYIADNAPSFKKSTIASYRDYLDAHLLKEFGADKVSQISAERIRAYQKKLWNGRSACRVNNIMTFFRIVMKECAEEGLISENPCVKVKRLPEDPADIDPLNLDELRAVLEACDQFYRPYFSILAWTGMRPMELRALTWREIDWKREQINIRRGRVKGQEAQTKTKSSMRTISMHPEAKKALQQLQARALTDIEGHICLTKKAKPFDKQFDQIWSKAIAKAGLKHRKSYQLRHTWASMALEAGESPAWVANQLGHTTMATLFKHYARWIPNKQAGNLIARVSMQDDRLQNRLHGDSGSTA